MGSWGTEEDAQLRRLRPGRTADVWLVSHSRGEHVAKLTYDAPEPVVQGLEAASIARAAGVDTCAPILTKDGALMVMVEWPPRTTHPLCMPSYVPGRAWRWRATPHGQSAAGSLLARLHRAWMESTLTVPARLLSYLRDPRDDMWQAARVHEALRRALARSLSDKGLTVGTPMPLHGRELVRWEGRWAELERFVPHTKPPPTWDSYVWMFASMGRLHRVLRNYERRRLPRPTSPRTDPRARSDAG